MHIISRKMIYDFGEKYPETMNSPKRWYNLIKEQKFNNLVEIKNVFSDVDYIEGLYIFNIGGNKARLIATINFKNSKIYIKTILSHSEYDKDKWRQYAGTKYH
jgi:mRNA interferase HigB